MAGGVHFGLTWQAPLSESHETYHRQHSRHRKHTKQSKNETRPTRDQNLQRTSLTRRQGQKNHRVQIHGDVGKIKRVLLGWLLLFPGVCRVDDCYKSLSRKFLLIECAGCGHTADLELTRIEVSFCSRIEVRAGIKDGN